MSIYERRGSWAGRCGSGTKSWWSEGRGSELINARWADETPNFTVMVVIRTFWPKIEPFPSLVEAMRDLELVYETWWAHLQVPIPSESSFPHKNEVFVLRQGEDKNFGQERDGEDDRQPLNWNNSRCTLEEITDYLSAWLKLWRSRDIQMRKDGPKREKKSHVPITACVDQ